MGRSHDDLECERSEITTTMYKLAVAKLGTKGLNRSNGVCGQLATCRVIFFFFFFLQPPVVVVYMSYQKTVAAARKKNVCGVWCDWPAPGTPVHCAKG